MSHRELMDRRVLGAVRFVSQVDGLPLAGPLHVTGRPSNPPGMTSVSIGPTSAHDSAAMPRPLGARMIAACRATTTVRYLSPGRSSESSSWLALANTSWGPTRSRGCSPS